MRTSSKEGTSSPIDSLRVDIAELTVSCILAWSSFDSSADFSLRRFWRTCAFCLTADLA